MANIVRKISNISGKKIKKIILSSINFSVKKEIIKRESKFETFRERNISHTDIIINDNNIDDCVSEYDTFICGSDLVWNIADTLVFQKGYWLTFKNTGKRNVIVLCIWIMFRFTIEQMVEK